MRRLPITSVSFVFAATSFACNARPEIESFVHTLTTGGAADEPTTGIIVEATTGTTEPSCSIVGDGDTGGDCAPDEKCNVHFALGPDAVPQCVPVDGDDQPGDECSAQESPPIDTCVAGSTCLTNDFGRSGRCVQLCDASFGCENADELCAPVFDGDLPLCVQACDPLDPTACVDDWICHELADQAAWYCAPRLAAQSGGHGSPCTPDAQGMCAAGFACLAAPNTVDSPLCTGGDTGGGCCAMLCDLDDDEAGCPSEVEQCVPYYNVPPPGMQNVGICALSLSRPRQTPGPDPVPPPGPGGPD